jgi:LacI family transcriptional regulator
VTNKKTARSGSQRAATISDVARAAGVSTMTVSRVINRAGNVRPDTVAAVDAAIASLNYSPNPAARSLAGARQLRVGLLYSNPSAYLSEFLIGVLDQANLNHVQLTVEKASAGADDAAVAQRLVDDGIDGILLSPPLGDSASLLALLNGTDIPFVVVAAGRSAPKVSVVSINDFAAARAMTTHLIELGHRRIGFITGNPDQTASSLRQEGYAAALQACGMLVDSELIAPGLFTYRSGLDATERLLQLPEPPTAIFASNDDMAAAAIAVAHRRGLDVPGELTVCGFDDTTMATRIWPELTTVRQPIGEMSRAALELLLRKVKAQRANVELTNDRQILEFSLVRRQSDAPPRS